MRLAATIEAEAESAFVSLMKPGATVYDVGASIGWFSLLAAREVGSNGTVCAFEPSVMYASLIEANARSNRFANVSVIAAAVADHDGWAYFSADDLQGRLSDAGSSCVPVLSLDTWVATTGQPPPDVVKIDVEGAETRVLRGMSEIIRSRHPTLLIELHDTASEVAEALTEFGYNHRPLEFPCATHEAPRWAHVLATPVQRDPSQR